ncbi:MAG TPA: hypothetical protein VH083_03490 [Myxococcales bacterium]|nr:hypothetical protein [Myxococcales bacterium]
MRNRLLQTPRNPHPRHEQRPPVLLQSRISGHPPRPSELGRPLRTRLELSQALNQDRSPLSAPPRARRSHAPWMSHLPLQRRDQQLQQFAHRLSR